MIKEKIINAIEDMRSKVGRDSKHIYINNETGEMLQGVSTVSSIIPKDWLSAWGAKEAVRALGFTDYQDFTLANEMWLKIKDCKSVEEYINILKEAKGASARKSKKAMVDGTMGHELLENLVDKRINGLTQDFVHSFIPLGTPLERPLAQFADWEVSSVDYWIAKEALVIRPDKRYAGQLDAIAMLKSGELALIDFKFSSNISEDYYLQTAGYAACFEPYGIKFDKRIIIRLPKTLEIDEWDPKTYKYRKVENKIEIKVVPTLYESDRDAFFNALPLKQWINYVTKLSTQEVKSKNKELLIEAKRLTVNSD